MCTIVGNKPAAKWVLLQTKLITSMRVKSLPALPLNKNIYVCMYVYSSSVGNDDEEW